jgi:hypothetical protein
MKVKCAKCSKFQEPVYHEGVEGVRQCQLGSTTVAESAPTPAPSQEPDWSSPGYTGKRYDLSELEAKVPAGRYAVQMADDRLHFFVVDKPDTGRWSGYTFVKEQASDTLHPVKSPKRREGILQAIAKDPGEAMLRYGLELGKCGHCGRTLTNEESRAAGIGPICSGKMPRGFFSSSSVASDVNPDACTPGQKCGDILNLCSKHSMEYQNKYGRAANE